MNRIRRTAKQQGQTPDEALTTTDSDVEAAPVIEQQAVPLASSSQEQDALLGTLPEDNHAASNGAQDSLPSNSELPARPRRGGKAVPQTSPLPSDAQAT